MNSIKSDADAECVQVQEAVAHFKWRWQNSYSIKWKTVNLIKCNSIRELSPLISLKSVVEILNCIAHIQFMRFVLYVGKYALAHEDKL